MDRALSILRRRPRSRAAFPVCGASGGRRACCAIADEAGLTVKKKTWRPGEKVAAATSSVVIQHFCLRRTLLQVHRRGRSAQRHPMMDV